MTSGLLTSCFSRHLSIAPQLFVVHPNQLRLHANPASSTSGDQILIRQHFQSYVIWEIKTVREAATAFGALEAIGAGIFNSIP